MHFWSCYLLLKEYGRIFLGSYKISRFHFMPAVVSSPPIEICVRHDCRKLRWRPDSSGWGQERVEFSCEYGNKPSVVIKFGKCSSWLTTCQLPRTVFAPRCYCLTKYKRPRWGGGGRANSITSVLNVFRNSQFVQNSRQAHRHDDGLVISLRKGKWAKELKELEQSQ